MRLVLLLSFVLICVCVSEATHYKLYREAKKPYRWEGEYDKAELLEDLLLVGGASFDVVELSPRKWELLQQKHVFIQLPFVERLDEVNENLRMTARWPFYRTAERELARNLGMLPDSQKYLIEEAMNVIIRLFERYYTGDSIQDGHNRGVFLSNFSYDWSYTAMNHLQRIQPTPGSKFFAGEEISIVDVMLAQFLRVAPYPLQNGPDLLSTHKNTLGLLEKVKS